MEASRSLSQKQCTELGKEHNQFGLFPMITAPSLTLSVQFSCATAIKSYGEENKKKKCYLQIHLRSQMSVLIMIVFLFLVVHFVHLFDYGWSYHVHMGLMMVLFLQHLADGLCFYSLNGIPFFSYKRKETLYTVYRSIRG